MKSVRLTAERYALALSQSVPDDEALSRSGDDLLALAHLVEQSADLRRALGNPVIDPNAKLSVVKELAGRLGARPAALHMLEILAAHGRLNLVRAVADAVRRTVDRRLGVVEVEVRSAAALGEDTRGRLATVLKKMTGGKIRVREVDDPELLGGCVVLIGGTVFDGSVKTKLATLRRRLAGAM